MTVEVVRPAAVSADESTRGVARRTIFEGEEAVVVESSIAGGTTTGWHHHGDRHAYGYVLEGAGVVEFGPGGDRSRESAAGEYFHVPPGTVHRDRTRRGEDTRVLVCFVGSGPVVVNVEGPAEG